MKKEQEQRKNSDDKRRRREKSRRKKEKHQLKIDMNMQMLVVLLLLLRLGVLANSSFDSNFGPQDCVFWTHKSATPSEHAQFGDRFQSNQFAANRNWDGSYTAPTLDPLQSQGMK